MIRTLLATTLLTGCVAMPVTGCVQYHVLVCDPEPPGDMLFLTDEEWIEAYGEPRGESDE